MYCLLVDRRFYPFSIINYKKAMMLYFRDYSVIEFHPYKKIHTVSRSYSLPIIIQIDDVINIKNYLVTPSRRLILLRDNYTCQYCGKPLDNNNATIDHIIPKSKGGLWSWLNLVACCEDCNQRKGDQIWQPKSKPKQPEPFIVLLRRYLPKLNMHTIDIWKQYLPIKFRKFIEKELRGSKDGSTVLVE